MNKTTLSANVTPSQPSTPQRQPYVAPALELLGPWSSVTLVISVPIGPGSFMQPRGGGQDF